SKRTVAKERLVRGQCYESKKDISDVVYCRSTDRNDISGVTRGYLPAKKRYRRQRQYAAAV
ncbi:TPA: hypothetical protein ACIBE2_001904, partial [Salmonella enterica subsp. diarizonae serovar 61:r:-]